MKKILIAWLLLFSIALSMRGCGEDIADVPTQEALSTEDVTLELLSAMIRQSVEAKAADKILSASMTDFALSLLKNSHCTGENTLLSPYSVYMALSMTANGAHGNTLSQIESLLGMPVAELNPYVLALQTGAGEEVAEANSLWLHESLTAKEDFLQNIKNYYQAQIYTSPFDNSTLEAMNHWIREQTKDRIPQALDQMNPNAMLYLINALTFDGNWETAYTTESITDQTFYSPSGEKIVEMMGSEEHMYLDDGRGTGFIKDYAGGQYSFVALLPNEGISLEDYLSALTADDLLRTIQNPQPVSVMTTMPKLQMENTVEMKDILSKMGMIDAFTMDADLSGINGQQDLFVSRILHKTSLQVDESGTQAGAVTIEEIVTKGVSLNQKFVFLNSPYVMGIYDKVNHCFLFLGVVEDPL